MNDQHFRFSNVLLSSFFLLQRTRPWSPPVRRWTPFSPLSPPWWRTRRMGPPLRSSGTLPTHSEKLRYRVLYLLIRAVDPDPQGSAFIFSPGSGFAFKIRIRSQEEIFKNKNSKNARKLVPDNCNFLSYLHKLHIFNFIFEQCFLNCRKLLKRYRTKVLKLDLDPHWEKLLDPDPLKINAYRYPPPC